jgi:D-alanyl-D-alanine carboxypeptidase
MRLAEHRAMTTILPRRAGLTNLATTPVGLAGLGWSAAVLSAALLAGSIGMWGGVGFPAPDSGAPDATNAPAGPTAADSPTPEATPTGSSTPSARSPKPTLAPTPTAMPTNIPTAMPTPVPEPIPTPPPAPTALPIPVHPGGTYLDVLTPHHAYGEWSITLLDTIYRLPAEYAPDDLVDSSVAGLSGGYAVRALVVDDLRAMAEAAAAAGAPIGVVSGFRSHDQQVSTFDYWVQVGGYEQALRTSARPGHSEHQLGTAIDFTSAGGAAPWTYADWAATPAGAWMSANAWRYGFVMSYPPKRYLETGYDYEPWHYRYIGRDLAAAATADGRTLREVLWDRQ